MSLFTVLASKTHLEILDILIVMIMALGFLCYKLFLKDEDEPPRYNRPTPRRGTSAASRHKKQPLKKMKRVAVKKNGQYTYYRINKYGEIFEEPDGEQE
jgi:hypothetical protein